MALMWALATAFCFACGVVLIRQSLPYTNAITSGWFTVGFNAIVLWPVFLFHPLPGLDPHSALDIVLTAAMAPFLARMFQYLSLSLMGVSRTSIIVGTTPMLAALMAVALLEEPVSALLAAGRVAAGAGAIIVTYEKSPAFKVKKILFLVPFAAALSFAARDIFGRIDMVNFGHPLVVATLVPSAAFILFSLLLLLGPKQFSFKLELQAVRYLIPAAIAYTLADICTFLALGAGYVVVVAPALHSTPLFVLLLSYLFLRREERLSFHVLAGAFIVVFGVTLTALARQL